MFAEGLGAIDFVAMMGKRCRKTTDEESLCIFAKARDRCCALLGRPVVAGEQLAFTDFVTGRAMAGAFHESAQG